MDSKIIEFIKNYKISDLEINNMINIAPMLKYATYNEFINNCKLLIEYGYPQEDLDLLMLANPKIFARSYKDLMDDLKELSQEYDDIEEILKENPTII